MLQEVHVERTQKRGIVGNIYKGKIVRVLPGMQAAFVDIGLDRAAFIHAAEISLREGPAVESISALVHEGQSLVVQVTKDPIGSKGARLTTQSYIKSLNWMPAGLREVIAIHTLNAGVSPKQTLAIYASMTAAMASQGISVPVGGVNEIPQTIAKLATAAGAEIKLGERVIGVKKGLVTTQDGEYPADLVVSSLDPEVLRVLLGKKPKAPTGKRSCSGVAIYAVLKQPLPEGTVTHSVVMPDEPAELYAALEAAVPPKQTMAFVNYYKAGEVYPNEKPTVAVLLTAPADGKTYDINSPWVRSEIDRISRVMGLDAPIDELFEDHLVLTPEYFGEWGSALGALYGKTHPLWQSGPFHNPQYRSIFRPWLRRVGASVHPGGGIPAVLGGTLISLRDLKPTI